MTSINTTGADTNFIVVTLAQNNKKVEMSNDGGHTWIDASGPKGGACIPGAEANTACNVNSLAIDSLDPLHKWYAATDFGIYETDNAGQAWQYMGPCLVSCRDIQLYTNKTTLRVATFGRGVWEVQLPIIWDGVESNVLSATKSNAGAELSWSVENEPSGATYFVERSLDGDAFTRIGSVNGTGASSGTHSYSFADNRTSAGTYLYQVHEIDASGAESYSNHVELHFGSDQIFSYEPYPNPFLLNGGAKNVTIAFELPQRDDAKVAIYNVQGTPVRTLIDKTLDGGPQSAEWDARDNTGSLVAPGAYFYSITTANSGTQTGKIMVEGE